MKPPSFNFVLGLFAGIVLGLVFSIAIHAKTTVRAVESEPKIVMIEHPATTGGRWSLLEGGRTNPIGHWIPSRQTTNVAFAIQVGNAYYWFAEFEKETQ